jgi:hypothetical protein
VAGAFADYLLLLVAAVFLQVAGLYDVELLKAA